MAKEDILVCGFALLMLVLGSFFAYLAIDNFNVYVEIRDGVIPVEPYDKIDHVEMFGCTSDGWYIANIFVSDTETNDFDNCMVRYNRDTGDFVIPSEAFGFESCVEIK